MMFSGRRPHETPNSQASGVEIAFYTSDVSAAFARAVAAGAVTLASPKIMPWGQTVAYFRSVEGTIVGLATRMGYHISHR